MGHGVFLSLWGYSCQPSGQMAHLPVSPVTSTTRQFSQSHTCLERPESQALSWELDTKVGRTHSLLGLPPAQR